VDAAGGPLGQHPQPGRAHEAFEVLDQGPPLPREHGAPRRLEALATAGSRQLFRFCQLEFGFAIGPSDGRYVARSGDGQLDVVVLRTLGAQTRGFMRRRKPREVPAGEPEPAAVPMTRATVIPAASFDEERTAEEWLERCRTGEGRREHEVADALSVLNEALRAHRLAAGDPYAADVSRWGPCAVRLGYGSGEDVADGRWRAAYEVPAPREGGGRRRMLAPQEQVAAILGGRRPAWPSEDLLLRARLDVDQGRLDQAAYQLDAALEALRAELSAEGAQEASTLDAPAGRVRELRSRRGELSTDDEAQSALKEALAAAERIARRRRHRPA
jgi:hypothetical protein